MIIFVAKEYPKLKRPDFVDARFIGHINESDFYILGTNDHLILRVFLNEDDDISTSYLDLTSAGRDFYKEKGYPQAKQKAIQKKLI